MADLIVPRSANPIEQALTFPKTLYHPVLGARTINNADEINTLPQPLYNWWPTAGEADLHRTDLEAQEVIHHARQYKLDGHQAELDAAPGEGAETKEGVEKPPIAVEPGTQPVRYSVQAEEHLNKLGAEPEEGEELPDGSGSEFIATGDPEKDREYKAKFGGTAARPASGDQGLEPL